MRGKKARLLRKQTKSPGRGRRVSAIKNGASQIVCVSAARRHYQQLKKVTRGARMGLLVAAHQYTVNAGRSRE